MKRNAHYADLILASTQVIYLLDAATAVWAWRSWLYWTALGISVVAPLYGMALHNYHQSHPCEKCIGDMPLNAQHVAEQRKRSLKLFHLATGRHAAPVWMMLLVVALLVPHTVEAVLMGTMAVFALITFITTWRHRPLQPVCPWCRWDGGGGDAEEEPIPTPDPVGAKTA